MKFKCLNCESGVSHSLGPHQEFRNVYIVKCGKCGLIQSYPIPDDVLLDNYYRVQYRQVRGENRISKMYLLEQTYRAEAQFKYICSNLGGFNGQTVFEAGCSTGALTELFSANGAIASGCEPDVQMAKYAHERRCLNVKNESIKNALKRNADRFRLIVMSHVFEHLPNPIEVLSQIKFHLEDRGFLFLEVPNDSEEKVIKMIRNGSTSAHLVFYSPETLKGVLEKCGYGLASIHTCGISLDKAVKDIFFGADEHSLSPFSKLKRKLKTLILNKPMAGAAVKHLNLRRWKVEKPEPYSDPEHNQTNYSIDSSRAGIGIRAIANIVASS